MCIKYPDPGPDRYPGAWDGMADNNDDDDESCRFSNYCPLLRPSGCWESISDISSLSLAGSDDQGWGMRRIL